MIMYFSQMLDVAIINRYRTLFSHQQ